MIYFVLPIKAHLKKYLLYKEKISITPEGDWIPATTTSIGLMMIHLFSSENDSFHKKNYKTGTQYLKVYVPSDLLKSQAYYFNASAAGIFLQYLQESFDEDMQMYIDGYKQNRGKIKSAIMSFMALLDITIDDIDLDALKQNNYRHRCQHHLLP